MSAKPLAPRERALRDVEEAALHYAREAGEKIALAFVDAAETTYRAIAAYPALGSTRYAYELGIPDLRCRQVKRFPYLIFYIERDDRIEIWRLLHAKSDIPAWMQEP
jgi:toxin ParE1/3/4